MVQIFEKFEHTFDIKSIDKERRIIRGVASLEEVDRDNEIIAIDAIEKSLQGYLANPVIRFKHQEPIGKAIEGTGIDRANKAFLVTAYITDKTQTAKDAWGLIEDGIIKSFSVGGKVLEKEVVKQGDRQIHKITNMELYEVSVVDIPSNRKSFFEVIAKSLKKQSKKDEIAQELFNKPYDELTDEEKAKVDEKLNEKSADIEKNGRPPKDWFDRCVRHVREAGSADDPEAVCGNLWHNIMHNATNNVEKDIDNFLTEKRVEQRGSQWCVIHCHGPDAGKPIKCFDTRAEAERMHAAIEANKSCLTDIKSAEMTNRIDDSKNKLEEKSCQKKQQKLKMSLLKKLQSK